MLAWESNQDLRNLGPLFGMLGSFHQVYPLEGYLQLVHIMVHAHLLLNYLSAWELAVGLSGTSSIYFSSKKTKLVIASCPR